MNLTLLQRTTIYPRVKAKSNAPRINNPDSILDDPEAEKSLMAAATRRALRIAA